MNAAVRPVHAIEGENDETQAVASEGGVLQYRGRFVVAVGLLAAGLSHLPVLSEHVIDAPYMGWLFGLFVVMCVSLTVPICFHDSRLVYWVAVVLCAVAVLLYAATRLTAFPQLASDVGNWLEPWGLVAVSAELFTVSTALLALLPPDQG